MSSRPASTRSRGRELFALFFSFLLTILIARSVIPPGSHGPFLLAILVYVLVYGTLYAVFWKLSGIILRRG